MLKKLKSQSGMTMALSIVIAVILTAVSLAVSALVATTSINQVNSTKRLYQKLELQNHMYDVLNKYYVDETIRKQINSKDESNNCDTYRFVDNHGFLNYIDEADVNKNYVIAIDYVTAVNSDPVYQLYIAECSDFKFGVCDKNALRFKVTFGYATYKVTEMESTLWTLEF